MFSWSSDSESTPEVVEYAQLARDELKNGESRVSAAESEVGAGNRRDSLTQHAYAPSSSDIAGIGCLVVAAEPELAQLASRSKVVRTPLWSAGRWWGRSVRGASRPAISRSANRARTRVTRMAGNRPGARRARTDVPCVLPQDIAGSPGSSRIRMRSSNFAHALARSMVREGCTRTRPVDGELMKGCAVAICRSLHPDGAR